MKQQDREQQEAIERLRTWIKEGDTLYSITRSTSRTNMSGIYSFLQLEPKKAPAWPSGVAIGWLSYNIQKALPQYRYDDDREGIVVKGCGFNRPWAVVSDLSCALFGRPDALTHLSL